MTQKTRNNRIRMQYNASAIAEEDFDSVEEVEEYFNSIMR